MVLTRIIHVGRLATQSLLAWSRPPRNHLYGLFPFISLLYFLDFPSTHNRHFPPFIPVCITFRPCPHHLVFRLQMSGIALDLIRFEVDFLRNLPPAECIRQEKATGEAWPMPGQRIHKSQTGFGKEADEREKFHLTSTDMNKNFDNLREMKEYRLAMQVKDALNDYGFDYAAFAASIPYMHPTLQQNLYKLLRECLVVMADDQRRYDDRNRSSHEEAKASWII